MSRQKEQNTRGGYNHPLGLAVATVALGMAIGINPGDVLDTPKQIERGTPEAATTSPDYTTSGDLNEVQKPGGVSLKVERPAAESLKVDRSGPASSKPGKPGSKSFKYYR